MICNQNFLQPFISAMSRKANVILVNTIVYGWQMVNIIFILMLNNKNELAMSLAPNQYNDFHKQMKSQVYCSTVKMANACTSVLMYADVPEAKEVLRVW